MQKLLYVASAALLLAGCSKHGTVTSAAGPAQEPVDRTAQTVPAQPDNYPAPPSTPPQGMYASQQSATPVNAAPQPEPPANPALSAYGQPQSAQPVYQQPACQPAYQPAACQPAYQPPAYPQPAYQQPAYQEPARQTTVAANEADRVDETPPPPPEQPAPARTFDGPMIPAGTPVHVRLDESLGTKYDHAGTRFYASLSEPVVVDGRTLLPVGTRFIGHLTESKPSGHFKGRAVIAVRLDGVVWHGREYSLETASIARVSRGRKGHDFKWIAGGGGGGAAIGAIAGGGEGALIGAAIGGGAGTVGALVTPRKQLHLSAETPLTFRLRRPVQL